MGRIVAIGGGDMRRGQTIGIDRRIVELAGKRRPRALLVPTASRDGEGYWESFRRVYGRLGCSCDVLWCLRERPARRALREKVARADLIYVGGGNTLLMMRRWKFLAVDRELRAAFRRGTVLCGASAGAICWFEYGHSDSMRGYGHDPWQYIRVAGLGLLAGTVCPHFNHADRTRDFRKMIRRKGGFGIALDDRCALEVVDGQYRVLAAGRAARAYTVRRRRERARVREVRRHRDRRPLAELYAAR